MKKILMALAGAVMFASAAFAEELTLMIYAQPQEKAILDKVIARFEATH